MALEQINSFDNRLSQQQTIAPLLALPPAPTTCRSFVLLPTITNPSIPRFTYQNEAVILAQRNALWPGLCAVDPDHRTWAALTRTDLIRQAGLTLSPGTRLGFTLADDSGHRFRKPGPGWGTPDVGGTWRHNTDSQGSGIDTRLFWRIQTRLFESKPAFTGFRGHGAGHADAWLIIGAALIPARDMVSMAAEPHGLIPSGPGGLTPSRLPSDAGRAHPRPLESTHWDFASTRTRGRRRGPRIGTVSLLWLEGMLASGVRGPVSQQEHVDSLLDDGI